MTDSSLDGKQLVLIGILLIALYFFGVPYFVGHSTQMTGNGQVTTSQGQPRLSQPVLQQTTPPGTEATESSGSLSEIEKLLN